MGCTHCSCSKSEPSPAAAAFSLLCATPPWLCTPRTLHTHTHADLFKTRRSVTLSDLFSTYQQTYNEQKQRRQQQQLGGGAAPQQQQEGAGQYRSITLPQMQMAVLQLTDMINMRGGVLTRKGAAAAASGAGGAEGAAGVPVEVA